MPQKEIKQLIGSMDLDSPSEDIPKGYHRTARNIRFRGLPPNMRAEVLWGNVLVNNTLLPGVGTNLTIGREYDSVKKRVFTFNYNSAGNHGIYVYNTLTGIFQRLVEVGMNTIGDPLGFTANWIYNIDFIYGDSEQGDIMYYIDTQYRPSKINIDTALNGNYGNIQRSFLDVAKEPISMPPLVVYETDSTVTVNNLRKKLFKFKARWVFDDQDKSVTSSQSEVPLPFSPFNTAIDTDPTINCRIAIIYQTGPSNVKKIELLASVSTGNQFSDFFLIASIDKIAANIGNNDVATFLFYNDKGYTNINVIESDQLFDYVPQQAVAQAVLNGNVLGYGNNTEGYPNLTNFSNGVDNSKITASTAPWYYGNYYALFSAFQSGQSGFSSGAIHIVVRGISLSSSISSNTYTVYFENGDEISYTSVDGDDAPAIIEGLRVDAIANGFTIISNGDNDLYISKTNAVLIRSELTSNYLYNSILNGSQFSYDWWSKHGFGLVYFDQKGRTNGVVYTDGFSVSTLPYSQSLDSAGDIPKLQASIYHRPPEWAYYYQWVRTKDLSKSKIIQWISERTLKDSNTGLGEDAYAYIGIESLNTFIKNNPGTPLGYGFTPSDRIRFIKLFNGPFGFTQLYTDKDFEIVASVINPTVNGVDYTGQFVKIRLPNTDGSFGFGDSSFANYFIELYTPAQSVANGLDLYFEYGERYAIANPTENDRFHQGQLQNQSDDLTIPATFEFTKGDYYNKLRSIQTGQEIIYTITAGYGPDADAGRITLGLTPTSISYTDPNIEVHASPFNNLIGFNLATDNSRYILKIASGTYTFRMKGTITITFDGTFGSAYPYEFFLQKNNGTKYQLVPQFNAQQAGTYTFNVDATFTMTTGEKIFIFGWSGNGNDDTRSFAATNLTVTRQAAFSQRCIDPNFSDYYASAVNSNGRAFVFDENANKVNYPVMLRWGGIYQSDTNINNTNRFYPEDFAEYSRSFGSIQRLGIYDNFLTIFQERKCLMTGIYSRYIENNNDDAQLVTTNSIITPNNYRAYLGENGVGNQADSVVQSGYVYYYVDPIKGELVRLSRDGNTPISQLYHTKTWAAENLPKYLKNYSYQYGGNARIAGTFNIWPDKTGEYMVLAQSGTNGSDTLFGEALAFDEAKNSFTSFWDINCEQILCAETTLYMWRNGQMWKLDQSTNVADFFNFKVDASITLVFNDNEPIKKVFNAIAYQSNRTWAAPILGDVETNTVNSQTGLMQESLIMEDDFDVLEMPNRYAAFNRDGNSMSDSDVAIWEGDVLCGNYIVVKLSYSDNAPSWLFAPYIVWQLNPRNF